MKKPLDVSTVFVGVCLIFVALYVVFPLVKNHHCEIIKKNAAINSITKDERKQCHFN